MGSSTALPSLIKEKLSWEPLRVVNPMMKALRGSCFCMTTVQLSNIDVLFDHYNAVFLVYNVAQAHDRLQQYEPAIVPRDEPVTRLLHALEELLVHYPCAAGLLVNNEADGRLEVRYPTYEHAGSDCYSAGHGSSLGKYGVRFQVAHADATLADLGHVSIPHPSLDLLYPCEPTQGTDDDGRFIMALQVTTFKCGGFALGHTCSHAYADGHTAAQFLQNLCSIARGAGLANPPTMSPRRVVIRPRDPPSPTHHLKLSHLINHTSQPVLNDYSQRKSATRFVFSRDALQSLRARVVAKLPSQFKGCSCNQILMSLLWVAHAQVRLKVHKLPGSHALGLKFPINLRPKNCIADLPQGYVGNACYICSVPATLEELCESSLPGVVMKIKRTMDNLDVRESFQSMVDYLEMKIKEKQPLNVLLSNIIRMPSLVGLPFYDTNCGWGPPMYVGRSSEQLLVQTIILDHPIARALNVLVAFSSEEEHTCFKGSIAEFLTS